jgi:hypothetical protein
MMYGEYDYDPNKLLNQKSMVNLNTDNIVHFAKGDLSPDYFAKAQLSNRSNQSRQGDPRRGKLSLQQPPPLVLHKVPESS